MPTRLAPKFDVGSFTEECKRASEDTVDAQSAVREVLVRAISDSRSVLAGVGDPSKGGIQTLYRSASLTILNISVISLPRDIIHSVTNPIETLTGAIHIYGGDFFAVPRSEWDPETLAERDWDIERAMRLFSDSNERFLGR